MPLDLKEGVYSFDAKELQYHVYMMVSIFAFSDN